jgi:hypothetical protein
LDNFTPIESINVTSLKAAEELLLRGHAPIFLQEHALPACVHRGWVKRARGRGYTLILAPLDPEAAVAKGGVVVLAPVDYRATEMPARSQAFSKARALGESSWSSGQAANKPPGMPSSDHGAELEDRQVH